LFGQCRFKKIFWPAVAGLSALQRGMALCAGFRLPALDYLLIALASNLSCSLPAHMGSTRHNLNGFFMNIFSNNASVRDLCSVLKSN
jgi:hypothetical protein